MYCIVGLLYFFFCIVLYFIVGPTVLHCIVLHCIVLHCIVLYCRTYCIMLHYFHCIAVYCITLYCIIGILGEEKVRAYMRKCHGVRTGAHRCHHHQTPRVTHDDASADRGRK